MRLPAFNLKFAHKVLAIGVMPMLLLLVLAGRLIVDDMKALQAARGELAGLAPALNDLRLIQATQRHRATGALSSDAELGQAQRAAASEVASALKAISNRSARPSKQAEAVAAKWQELHSGSAEGALGQEQTFALETSMVMSEFELLEDTVDDAGITQDSDRANYHLVRALFFQIPTLAEALARARDISTNALARGHLSPSDRAALQGTQETGNLTIVSLIKSLQKAAGDEPSLKPALDELEAKSTAEAVGVLKLVEEHVIEAGMLTHDPVAFYKVTTASIDAQFAAISQASHLLETRLEARVDQVRGDLLRIIVGTAVASVLSLGIAMVVSRRVTQALVNAVHVAKTVASGDLTSQVQVTSKDEAGDLLVALQQMNAGLTRVVTEVRDGSDSIATGIGQIAAGNADLSTRTEEQASSLQQTAASLEQLVSTVSQNAESSKASQGLASEAYELAVQGGATVADVAKVMDDIDASASKMSDIIGTIDSIAFQTNILALNAAVEAARAGAEGKGFAVVASEVRSLAKRSADAAKEIQALILHSGNQTRAGTTLASQAANQMGTIVERIKKVSDLAKEVDAASREQSVALTQVNSAVGQLDRATQQNAALVQESAAAAQSLREQADRLAEAVGAFQIANVANAV
jgi:methyl-accepting chemotaxis protein